MKYLALLKDSLREAVDTKVFYVMVVLSIILIAIVACIGFTPQPVAKLADRYTTRPLNLTAEEWKKMPIQLPDEDIPSTKGLYSQIKVEPADGAPDSPASPLLFQVRAQYPRADEAARIRKSPAATIEF